MEIFHSSGGPTEIGGTAVQRVGRSCQRNWGINVLRSPPWIHRSLAQTKHLTYQSYAPLNKSYEMGLSGSSVNENPSSSTLSGVLRDSSIAAAQANQSSIPVFKQLMMGERVGGNSLI